MVANGYKDTEIGVIPIEWEVTKLSEVCKFKQGIQIPLEEQYTTQINDTIRFLRISDYTQSTDDIRFVSKDYSDYIISSGDVVMVRYGETAGFIGTNLSGVLANNLFSINPNEKIMKKYLYTYMNDEKIYNYLKSLRAAGAMPAVNFKSLNIIKIPLPPLKEQEKIADILSTADDKIAAIASQIQKAETLKKGLLQKLLSEGIGHSEFKDSELGKIPESWEVVKVKELLSKNILKSVQDGNHGEIHPKSSDYVEKGIPFVMANNITKNSLDINSCNKISEQQYNTLRIGHSCGGDVLLTHKATIGLTAIVPLDISIMLTPQVTAYNILNTDILFNVYLYYYFQSSSFQNKLTIYSKQSTRSYIGITAQKELFIVIPPLEEQKQIADILSTADEKLEVLIAKKEKHETLKKGLLQKLLRGEVRVNV